MPYFSIVLGRCSAEVVVPQDGATVAPPEVEDTGTWNHSSSAKWPFFLPRAQQIRHFFLVRNEPRRKGRSGREWSSQCWPDAYQEMIDVHCPGPEICCIYGPITGKECLCANERQYIWSIVEKSYQDSRTRLVFRAVRRRQPFAAGQVDTYHFV